MAERISGAAGELSLASLFRSPFLIPSVALHFIAFYLALGVGSFPVNPDVKSIPVQLLDVGTGNSLDKSIGRGHGPGGPRALPKLGSPVPARQQTGKLDAGSLEATTPKEEAAPAAKAPALPAPKILAEAGHSRPMAVRETSPDSLVQLPVKGPARELGSALNSEDKQRRAALKGIGDGAGIKALKEGIQLPGALKGTGTGAGPYGVPGGSASGTGMSGGGTGQGIGGGGRSGLQGKSLAKQEADYSSYMKLIEQRARSVWKYPEGVTGVQKVTVRFTLDKAGKLAQADVMDSTDSRLNSSALEAMRKASPFPPMPESLQYLAGEPLIIRFTVSIRVRG